MAAAVLAGAGAEAADSPAVPASVLTLEQVLADVENVNLSVLSTREFIRQSEESARLTRSAVLPQINLQATQARTDRGIGGPANFFDAGLYGTLSVLDLQQHANLRAARQAILASRYDYDAAVQAVMASVAGQYFEHLRDLAFDKVIDSNIERAKVLLTLARNQLEAGVATQIDVTRAEAELVTQEQAKLQQATIILDSALRIKRLLNLDLASPLTLDEFQVRRDLEETIRGLTLEGVLERRPDFQAQAAAVEQRRLALRAAGRERLPTVDVFAQTGVNTEVILDGDEEDFWSVGARVNMPVFEGNRISANERIAQSRVRQGEFQLADARARIEAELRIALQDVESQIAQIGVAEKNRALAEEELRLARVRYEQGVADNRELIDAENRYTSASFNLVRAVYSYHLARVELARVRGDVRLILSERAR